MGKNIIQQARGHGSLTYRVRRKAFLHRIKYPLDSTIADGNAEVIKLVHSAGHFAPLAKIKMGNVIFFNPAACGIYEGQKIQILKNAEVKEGNILRLKDIPTKTNVFNIESKPNDGGKFMRAGGTSATVVKKENGLVYVMMPSKKEKAFNEECRATIGVISGSGRKDKPVVKAGKMWYIKKAKNKLWPRTSAVKFNAIDHPFGSGRGKNLTHGKLGKIPRKNSPPGKKVGTLSPRRTGKGKGGNKSAIK